MTMLADRVLSPWPFVLLDEVATRGSGHTPSRRHREYWDGPSQIKWVSLADTGRLDNGLITDTEHSITEAGLAHSAAVLRPADTVILLRGSSVGKSAVLGSGMAVSQDYVTWTCGPMLDPWFVYYFLQSRKAEFARIGFGNTIKTIGLDYFRHLAIPIPEIPEQRGISEALQGADCLITSLQRTIAKKEAIKQGMMQELLGGKNRLHGFSGQWSECALGELGTFLKGRGVKRDDIRRSGVPCIRYGELYTTFRDYTDRVVSYVDFDVAATSLPIRSGDLLFAGSGETREEIGICVAYVGAAPAVAGGDIIVLRGSNLNPIYLALLLNTPVVAAQKAKRGQGDAVVHISSRALADIRLLLPSRREQDAIAAIVTNANDELSALRGRLTKAKDIKQGMMQELLTGRTRLKVPEEAA
jgi:type I restriction enzyme S subunit